jgi:serine/threonine-protein kinase
MLSLVTGKNGQAPAGVEVQLEKVLASEAFRNAPRLSEFLRFSVGASLRGEAGQIKEYLIGVEVFGRGSEYDPRVDPVVRVEARRLRAKLREYYEEEGREDALRIHFPKGGYVPVFENREPDGSESGAWSLPGRRSLLLAAAGAAGAMTAYWFGMSGQNSPARTRIAVLPMRAYGSGESEDLHRLTDEVAEAMLSELSRHQDLSVISWPTVAGYRAAGKTVPEISKELDAGHLAAVSALRSSDGLTVRVHLVEGAADRKRWAERYEFPPETQALPPDFPREVASEIQRQLQAQTQ